jgi:trans-2,3-dihydro-3-hydroxyanthranilate isomerase
MDRSYRFVTVDVFTEQRFGGNPLAVFPEADGLSDAEMQSLAAEFNLSETTFVLPPDDPAYSARVRIFNRTYKMPFAGHPNVGTAYVLAQMGRDNDGRLEFEEKAGLVTVDVSRDPAGAVRGATIAAPQPLSLGCELTPKDVAACTGLDAGDVITATHPPVEASVGVTFVIAEVSESALARAVPDTAAFRRVLAATPALNGRFSLYVYSCDADSVRARMFSPLSGTYEDPATGSAATALTALLLTHSGEDTISHDIRQGIEMGRPSLLRASAFRAGDGIRASVGGTCVPVLRGEAQV